MKRIKLLLTLAFIAIFMTSCTDQQYHQNRYMLYIYADWNGTSLDVNSEAGNQINNAIINQIEFLSNRGLSFSWYDNRDISKFDAQEADQSMDEAAKQVFLSWIDDYQMSINNLKDSFNEMVNEKEAQLEEENSKISYLIKYRLSKDVGENEEFVMMESDPTYLNYPEIE